MRICGVLNLENQRIYFCDKGLYGYSDPGYMR